MDFKYTYIYIYVYFILFYCILARQTLLIENYNKTSVKI